MIRLRLASAVIAALSLLTSAATASAECAWILWAGGVKTSGEGVYAPIEGYPTKAECMQTASRYISRAEHHPEWENVWVSVRVWLTSWDIGHRPSLKDVALAEQLDKLYENYAT